MKKKFKIKSNFDKPITLTEKELMVVKGGHMTTTVKSLIASIECTNCPHCESDIGTHIC